MMLARYLNEVSNTTSTYLVAVKNAPEFHTPNSELRNPHSIDQERQTAPKTFPTKKPCQKQGF
jgi:hypothetical protein